MKLRTEMGPLGTALLAALGVLPVSCGGVFRSSDDGTNGGTTSTGGTRSGSGGNNGSGATAGYGTGGSHADGGAYGTGGSYGGDAGSGSINPFPCSAPSPLIPNAETGFEVCSSGYIHRAERGTCPSTLPRPDAVEPACGVTGGAGGAPDQPTDECEHDSDCTDQAFGQCGYSYGFDGFGCTQCNYGCGTDADCGEGQICLCGEPAGTCVYATCATDADCKPGYNCASYLDNPGCGTTQFACQRPGDGCGGDLDCQAGAGSLCTIPDPDQGTRTCGDYECAIGRPFLVQGVARVAGAEARVDWTGRDVTPNLQGISSALRARLAAEWTRAAELEHASIAAFARFALQLLSVGAPASLIERTTAAMADETVHAKFCFALAGAYRGESVGPAKLNLEHSLDEGSFEEIVVTAIREGCVGETVAALEATEAAAHATDPVVRDALSTISADESRHAELAWRFVKWAVESGGETIRRACEREFDRIVAAERCDATSEEVDAVSRELLSNGVLPHAVRLELRARAVREVIDPCRTALLSREALSQEEPSHEALSSEVVRESASATV